MGVISNPSVRTPLTAISVALTLESNSNHERQSFPAGVWTVALCEQHMSRSSCDSPICNVDSQSCPACSAMIFIYLGTVRVVEECRELVRGTQVPLLEAFVNHARCSFAERLRFITSRINLVSPENMDNSRATLVLKDWYLFNQNSSVRRASSRQQAY